MPSEHVTLDVDGETFDGRLNAPEGDPDAGILVVPGANHGPFGDVFDRFAETAADEGYLVARFETWSGTDDLDEKSMADHASEIEAGVDFLRDAGCETVYVVAKSYGGRLALELVPEDVDSTVDRMVLWAPAVIFGEHPEAPTIDAPELTDIDLPLRILQGDEDTIPLESAANIAEHLPNGDLVELDGEDHSFQRDQDTIIDETLEFIET